MTKQLMPLVSLDFVVAKGNSFAEMRDNFLSNPEGAALYKAGDVKLIWVSEGDLYMQRMNVEIYNMNLSMGTHDNPEEGV